MVNDFGESNCKFQLFQAFTGFFASGFLSCFLGKNLLPCWVCEKIVSFLTSIIAQNPKKVGGFLYYFFTRQSCVKKNGGFYGRF